MAKYRRMTYADRVIIERLFNSGCSYRAIARRIGFSVASVHYEVQRGLCDIIDWRTYDTVRRYSATIADDDAIYQASAKGAEIKLGKRYDYAQMVAERIKAGESPDSIVGSLRLENKWTVSTVTLYRYIDQGYIPGITNKDLLVKRHKKRDYKKVRSVPRPPRGLSIEKRPTEIAHRRVFGHWEMDTVIGHKSGAGEALLVLTERFTRYEIIVKLNDKTAQSVLDGLSRAISRYPSGTFKTLTVDNGAEFANYHGMKKLVGEIYYCHPYCSSERGSNENANRLIRRFFPKGQSLFNRTQRDCDAVANFMNNMHRRVLGYRTAGDLFNEQLALSVG